MRRDRKNAVCCGIILILTLVTSQQLLAAPLYVNDGTSSDWQDNPLVRGLVTVTYISSSGLGSDATIECNAIATFPPILPLYFQLSAPSATGSFHLDYVIELSAPVVLDSSDFVVNPLAGATDTVVVKRMYSGIDSSGNYFDLLGTQTSIDGSSPPTIVFANGFRKIYIELVGQFTPPSAESSNTPVQIDPGLVIDVYGTRLAVPEPSALTHLMIGGILSGFAAAHRMRRLRSRV